MNTKASDFFEHEADRLYSLPLAEFTAARNELAKELRQAGEKEAAERIKDLVKPSVSAWAVNRLYQSERESFDQLLAAGEQLGSAVAEGPGPLRKATEEKRRVLGGLLRAAEAILNDAGHAMSPGMRQRISQTLEALSAHGTAGGEPRPGRLTADQQPPGFDVLLGVAPRRKSSEAAGSRGTRKAKKSAAAEVTKRKLQAAEAALREVESERSGVSRRVAAAAKALRKAETAAKKAAERATTAKRRAREAAEQETAKAAELKRARVELTQLERLDLQVARRVETARRKVERLR